MGMLPKKYTKMTFEFPTDEYVYLKMACAKKGVSMKEFVTEAIIQRVENFEEEFDKASLKAARQEIEENKGISWDEMEKDLGWDKL